MASTAHALHILVKHKEIAEDKQDVTDKLNKESKDKEDNKE